MYLQTIDENKNLLIEPFKKYNRKFTALLSRLPENFYYSIGNIPFVKNKIFFIYPEYIYVTDNNLELLTKFPNNDSKYWFGGYSEYVGSYFLINQKNKNRRFIDFKKLLILERINDRTKIILIRTLSIALIIVIILWLLSLKKSMKTLRKRNDELKKSREELENTTAILIQNEKFVLLGTIAASFAHQLNSPLGAILNSAERLKRKITDANLDLILRSAEFMKTKISKFLYSAKGEIDDDSKCTDFDEVWQTWYDLFATEFLTNQISIVCNFENQCKISVSKSELMEILSNIIFNARYSILEKNHIDKKIEISLTPHSKGKCLLKISDTGTGFPDKILQNPFEPFYTTKPKGMGTGLGLWLTKKIVEKNNGEIKIYNSENGAVVEIMFKQC